MTDPEGGPQEQAGQQQQRQRPRPRQRKPPQRQQQQQAAQQQQQPQQSDDHQQQPQQQQQQQQQQQRDGASGQRQRPSRPKPQHRQGRGGAQGHGGRAGEVSEEVAAAPKTSSTLDLHLTDRRFDELSVSESTKRAVTEVLKFERLTQVQDATLQLIMDGHDVLAKARTGTGKTMAFLIPSVESLSKSSTTLPPKGDVSVMILSPTRELAQQITNEARQLLTYHEPLRVDVVFGGTNMDREKKRLRSERLDFLIATPGRLIDHLENSDLAKKLARLRVLVLDEADQLLEMGFRPAIEKILTFLPPSAGRQTLLFSATMPQGVRQVAGLALRDGHKFVDTVGEDDETNVQVKQSVAVVSWEQQFAYMHSLLEQHRRKPDHKVLVFFTTARLTQYAAELMEKAGINVMEIHSRKSQPHRTRVSEQFRAAQSGILFSSDVSARGVDYPDVTLVLQIGVPSSKEQYVHRLGRTGRAGKVGEGILVLGPDETFFTDSLKDLPVETIPQPHVSVGSIEAIAAAIPRVDERTASMAYQAWLGYYNGVRGTGWSKPQLVQEANKFSTYMGLSEPPALLKKTIGMMGLRGVPGLRVETDPHARGGGGRGGRGGNPRRRDPPQARAPNGHDAEATTNITTGISARPPSPGPVPLPPPQRVAHDQRPPPPPRRPSNPRTMETGAGMHQHHRGINQPPRRDSRTGERGRGPRRGGGGGRGTGGGGGGARAEV